MAVLVAVGVAVNVGSRVAVSVGVGVCVSVGMVVGVSVSLGFCVGVGSSVSVEVAEAVSTVVGVHRTDVSVASVGPVRVCVGVGWKSSVNAQPPRQ